MSNIIDSIFADVCLDERVSDGIFKLEEDEHINALRDHFIKRGITQEDSINLTNRMLEGKFPERQAYNRDGILCTFPTPEYKQRAIQRGTHFEKSPVPSNAQTKTTQQNLPPRNDIIPPKELDNTNSKFDNSTEEPEKKVPTIFNNGNALEVEPLHSDNTSTSLTASAPPLPVPVVSPRTPERIAAEKEIVNQIIATDDSVLSNIENPLNENNSVLLQYQLREIYKKCDEWAFREAIKFLTPHIKS